MYACVFLFSTTDGSYEGVDGESVYRSSGALGALCDAGVRGEVVGREEGISGNSLTNQAALFNESYLEIPFHPDFSKSGSFGMTLWLKLPEIEGPGEHGDNMLTSLSSGWGSGTDDPLWGSGGGGGGGNEGPYQIVVDFASFFNGTAHGYVIVINPCGQPEFWLATNQSIDVNPPNFNKTCPLLSASDCSPLTPTTCSGYQLVTTAATYGNLPPGVWSVIRCGDCDLGMEWGLISVGWNVDESETDCVESSFCSGEQTFHFNSRMIGTATTSHALQTNRPLLIGGTDRLLPLGGGDGEGEGEGEGDWESDTLSSNSALTGFTGLVDEVSLFDRPLTANESRELFEYGSSEKQKVWIRVESVDGIGMGHDNDIVQEWNGDFEEVEPLDWNAVSNDEIELDEGTALQFTWNTTR